VPFGGPANPEAFRAFSPTGKVPALVDGSITVWDSLSIVEYVAERHAGVWPAEARRSRVGAFDDCIRVTLTSIGAPLARDLARLQELWMDGIGRFGGPFLTGSYFCAVDAFFAPVAFRIQTFEPPLAEGARHRRMA
jgi:glutathione S-transferase